MNLFKRKKTIRKKILSSILSYRNFLNQDVTEVFIGKKTIFFLLGFSIGGILVGRTLWEYMRYAIPLPYIMLIGVSLFAVSGMALRSFK